MVKMYEVGQRVCFSSGKEAKIESVFGDNVKNAKYHVAIKKSFKMFVSHKRLFGAMFSDGEKVKIKGTDIEATVESCRIWPDKNLYEVKTLDGKTESVYEKYLELC